MKNQGLWIGGVAVLAIAVVVGIILAGNHKSSTPSSNTKSTTTSGQPTSADIIRTLSKSDGTQYLADAKNMPLYTYAADTSGKSNCTGSCLTSWPIYSAANAPSTLPAGVSVITRSDGSKQYAFNGMPLYTFTGDSAGKVTGDGVDNFNLTKPAAAAPASSAPTNSAPSSSNSSNSNNSNPYNY
jgi:predicted lipoprotein with Yx(FWY)xxD motif